jgi:N-methylhydantoinase A
LSIATGKMFIGIDVGGTFTDIVLYDNDSRESKVVKVPTSSKNIEEAIIDAIDLTRVDPGDVKIISHATTTATNALITRSGLAKTALVTNRGFRDVLEIARQRRPELYNLYSKRPPPIVKRRDRFTIGGRLLYNGTELEPINKPEIRKLSDKLVKGKYDCVVIGMLNSYANPSQENSIAKIIAEKYKNYVLTSSGVNNEYREYERISTAVVNAALIPLVSRYLGALSEKLKQKGYVAPIYLMNSDGSVCTLSQPMQLPISIIESGPAAGVLACADLAKSLSLEKVATFDMGGTTAKAGMITNFQPDISYEFEASGATHSGRSIKGSGYPVRYPFIDLAEVSAGGGTIAWVDDGGALKLGPNSAGADPGPAAYGKGGTLPTVTDANVITGRLSPTHLLGGKMELHPDLSKKAVSEQISEKLGISIKEASTNIIRIVNHEMARAISIVSVERGRDPRDYALIAFGGAGPLHSCDLAEEMSISKVIVPVHPGLFSAYGLLTVDFARMFSLPVMTTELDSLEDVFEKLREKSRSVLAEEGLDKFASIESVDLRYYGQSYEINLPYRPAEDLRKRFDTKHNELYGYFSAENRVEAVNAKVRAIVEVPKIQRRSAEISADGDKTPKQFKTRPAWISGKESTVKIFLREELSSGSGDGPCIIEEYDSTTVVNSGWSWKVDRFLNIQLENLTGENNL